MPWAYTRGGAAKKARVKRSAVEGSLKSRSCFLHLAEQDVFNDIKETERFRRFYFGKE